MILPGKYSQLHNEVNTADSYDVRENLKTFLREENTEHIENECESDVAVVT